MVAASSAGHFGAASATWEHVHRHFAVAALFVARNAAYPSGGPKIDSHVDFDSTAAWRHHVSMPPSSRSQSAATTALTAGICELFRVKRLREIPQWRILGRCLPLTSQVLGEFAAQMRSALVCNEPALSYKDICRAYNNTYTIRQLLKSGQTRPNPAQISLIE